MMKTCLYTYNRIFFKVWEMLLNSYWLVLVSNRTIHFDILLRNRHSIKKHFCDLMCTLEKSHFAFSDSHLFMMMLA